MRTLTTFIFVVAYMLILLAVRALMLGAKWALGNVATAESSRLNMTEIQTLWDGR